MPDSDPWVVRQQDTTSGSAGSVAGPGGISQLELQQLVSQELTAQGAMTSDQTDTKIAAALAAYTPPKATTQDATHTTTSLAAMASADFPLELATSALLRRVQLSTPGWIRLYRTQAARTSDASRAINVAAEGEGEAGLVLDVVLPHAGALELWLEGANAAAATTTYYARLTNYDTVARAVTLTLSYLALE